MKNSNKITIKKTISNAFTFLIILGFATFCISYLNSGGDKDKTFVFQRRISIVSSESMLPKFKKWSAVVCKNVDYDDVKVGDIITYRKYLNEDKTEKQIIIHRVKEKHKDYIITKGDNNPTQDSWKVYPDEVISKYEFKITPW